MADARTGGEVLRFLALGGGNTVLGYALLLGLGLVLPTGVAYTIAYACGMAVNYLLAGPVVFRSDPSPARRAAYTAWYALLYVVGLGVVLVGEALGVRPPALLALLPFLVTVPLGFLGGRVLLSDRPVKELRP